jgi:hypothetical protein
VQWVGEKKLNQIFGGAMKVNVAPPLAMTEPECCLVCMSMMENEEMVRLLPNYNHVFHADCIDLWLGLRSMCPVCRTEANLLRVQPHPCEPLAPVHGGAVKIISGL